MLKRENFYTFIYICHFLFIKKKKALFFLNTASFLSARTLKISQFPRYAFPNARTVLTRSDRARGDIFDFFPPCSLFGSRLVRRVLQNLGQFLSAFLFFFLRRPVRVSRCFSARSLFYDRKTFHEIDVSWL